MDRRVWLLVATFAALALAFGTGGFSAAELDRGVSVAVVDHEDAFVGLADPGSQGTRPDWPDEWSPREEPVTVENQRVALFGVYNRFGDTTLRVTARVPDGTSPDVSAVSTTHVAPRRTGLVSGTVDCGQLSGRSHHEVDLTVVVDGTDGGFHGTIDYTVTVLCASAGKTPETSPSTTDNTTETTAD
jgi:hypothetical protein